MAALVGVVCSSETSGCGPANALSACATSQLVVTLYVCVAEGTCAVRAAVVICCFSSTVLPDNAWNGAENVAVNTTCDVPAGTEKERTPGDCFGVRAVPS